MKLTKLYVNDQAKHVVLPKVMGHAANELYINKKIHTYIHTHTQTHIRTYTHTHTHTQTHIHTHTHKHTHTHTNITPACGERESINSRTIK